MTWNTPYLGTPRGATFTSSGGTTVLSDLSISGALDVGAIDATDTVTLSGALNTSSTISSTDQISAQSLSFDTLAGSGITIGSSTAAGILWVTVGASGLSIGIESGGSLYWAASTVSAA